MQPDNLSKVEHASVSAGMSIYYRYDMTDLFGPYTVVKTFRDHDGAKALLRAGGNDRSILLADDEDYGALYIYTPTKS